MKTEAYKCATCSKLFDTDSACAAHEIPCAQKAAERQASDALRESQLAEAERIYLAAAAQDRPLRVLVADGSADCLAFARTRCGEVTWYCNVPIRFDSSRYLDEIYDKMIEAAREAGKPS
jgi:hypothetical protein